MRILVVDDSASQRLMLRSILEHQDHEVYEAEDGQSAWELIQHGSIQMVVILLTNLLLPILYTQNPVTAVNRLLAGLKPILIFQLMLDSKL